MFTPQPRERVSLNYQDLKHSEKLLEMFSMFSFYGLKETHNPFGEERCMHHKQAFVYNKNSTG